MTLSNVMTTFEEPDPRIKESKSQESARVTRQANGSEIVGHCAGQALSGESNQVTLSGLYSRSRTVGKRGANEEVVGEKRRSGFSFTCNACGAETEDISPLGPEGVVICEECAEPPRYHWLRDAFVEQFR